MPEFTFLVGIGSEGENREAAELALQGVLVPLLRSRNPASPIEAWWIAEDDRHDGSDLDSAVFVPPGRQAAAQGLLEERLEASPYVQEAQRLLDAELAAEGPRPARDLDSSDVEADAARMMAELEAAQPWVVETTFNTDPEGKPVEEWDDSNRTLHGPFATEEEARHFSEEVWPDGDTDVREQVWFQLNSPESLGG
jgi:hypothetical protein